MPRVVMTIAACGWLALATGGGGFRRSFGASANPAWVAVLVAIRLCLARHDLEVHAERVDLDAFAFACDRVTAVLSARGRCCAGGRALPSGRTVSGAPVRTAP